MKYAVNMPALGRLLAGTAIAVAALGAWAVTPAAAASNNAAIHLKDLDHPVGCYLPAFASGLSVDLHTNTGISTVHTKSGNTKLICHFNIPAAGKPAKVIKKAGFACGIFLPHSSAVTSNTKADSTPGGKAKLECEINPSALH